MAWPGLTSVRFCVNSTDFFSFLLFSLNTKINFPIALNFDGVIIDNDNREKKSTKG